MELNLYSLLGDYVDSRQRGPLEGAAEYNAPKRTECIQRRDLDKIRARERFL